MRDPNRIAHLLVLLGKLWKRNSDLRFAQIIEILKSKLCIDDMFYNLAGKNPNLQIRGASRFEVLETYKITQIQNGNGQLAYMNKLQEYYKGEIK